MYHHVSRTLYRRLVPLLHDDPKEGGIKAQRQRLLDACEATMKRLATEPEYFANPSRFLFREIRMLFPLHEQCAVWRLVEHDVAAAAPVLKHWHTLQRRDCDALTRGGQPCRREALPGSRFCPSHRHLNEVFAEAATAA